MILILGKGGQVGKALQEELGAGAVAYDSAAVNLADPALAAKLDALAGEHRFTTLINAAAYTAVDKAESEPDLAMRINGDAVGIIAEWCKRNNVVLVHYSTDYVFDGTGSHAHKENEATGPLSVYGQSKVRGEELIAASGANYLIFRTSWVYDETGKNFVNTMRRLFKEREQLNVVADQVGAPTYAKHLAQATVTALSNIKNMTIFPSGIYHLCGGGHISWYEFAQAIFALASRVESGIKCSSILPIKTSEYPTPAKRPLNSRLDCTKAKETLGIGLANWKDALNEYYESIRLRD